MNPRIEKLPKHKGFPIPYFATRRKDRTPDFKIVDQDRRKVCAVERRCWICGEPLGYWVVFIGGPVSIEHGLFNDGPMHEECAADAMAICPFLVGTMDYAPPESFREDLHDEKIEWAGGPARAFAPPTRTAIYKTRGFGVAVLKNTWLFRAAQAVSIEWKERNAEK